MREFRTSDVTHSCSENYDEVTACTSGDVPRVSAWHTHRHLYRRVPTTSVNTTHAADRRRHRRAWTDLCIGRWRQLHPRLRTQRRFHLQVTINVAAPIIISTWQGVGILANWQYRLVIVAKNYK